MSHEEHHGELLQSLSKEYKQILESSGQAIYVYLDDDHFLCNQKFASLLGYGSPKDVGAVKGSFLDALVDEQSKDGLVSAYQKSQEKFEGSSIKVAWKKKDGGSVSTNCILVPISFEGHLLALHFIG